MASFEDDPFDVRMRLLHHLFSFFFKKKKEIILFCFLSEYYLLASCMEPFLPDHKIFLNRDGIIVVRARIERREPVCQPDEAIKDWRDYIFFYSSSFPPLFFGRISLYIFFCLC